MRGDLHEGIRKRSKWRDRQAARSPAGRRRPSGDRLHDDGFEGRLPAGARRRAGGRSTCSTRRPSALPSARPSRTRSSTRRPPSAEGSTRGISTATSRSPTGCGPREPTTCSPPGGRPASNASWLRASRAGRARERAAEIKSETDPLDPNPPEKMRSTLGRDPASRGARSPAPTASSCATAASTGPARARSSILPASRSSIVVKRKFPMIGDGGGVWSFIHVADAADATVKALELGEPGIYNVVDDEPVAVAEWLPAVARAGRREAAASPAALDRTPRRRRARGDHDDRGTGRVQREGQAGAGLGPGASELAGRRWRAGDDATSA